MKCVLQTSFFLMMWQLAFFYTKSVGKCQRERKLIICNNNDAGPWWKDVSQTLNCFVIIAS